MQLNKPNVRQALALATCALVHGTAQAEEGEWTKSGSLLYYTEKDRVSVIAPTLFATQELGDEETLTVRMVYDSLSGASPNGASATTAPQTFGTGASSYTTPAGELPLKAFADSRVALGVDWAVRTSSESGRTLTGNFSAETDYSSLGGSVTWTRDFNNKLTTLAWGVGTSFDVISAASGAPVGLQSVNAVVQTGTGTAQTKTSCSGGEDGDHDKATGVTQAGATTGGEQASCGENKTTVDLLLGVTQILSRRTLLQLNYSLSQTTGYLTDPYKVVSIVNPTSGATVDYVNEMRPSSRLAHVIYGKLVHHFDEDVVHLNYRYFRDDWHVRAHSAELQYRFRVTDWFYVEPQFRYHKQSRASFYRHSLPGSYTTLPGNQTGVDFASADLRLGRMTTRSAGLKLGIELGGGELSLRAVRMLETGDRHPSNAIGVQKQVNLYPTMEATIVTMGFSTQL